MWLVCLSVILVYRFSGTLSIGKLHKLCPIFLYHFSGTAQLETISLEALHKLADGLEVEYTEDTPLKQLAEKIAAVEVTTEI